MIRIDNVNEGSPREIDFAAVLDDGREVEGCLRQRAIDGNPWDVTMDDDYFAEGTMALELSDTALIEYALQDWKPA